MDRILLAINEKITSYPECKIRAWHDGYAAYLVKGKEITLLNNGLIKIEGCAPCDEIEAMKLLEI